MPLKVNAQALRGPIAKATSHPLRVVAFSLMAERPTSAKEVAEYTGEPEGNAAYHVRELKKLKVIEEVNSEARRGATEVWFRAVRRPLVTTEEWADFTPQERDDFSSWILLWAMMDVERSRNAGVFDLRPERHLSRNPMNLDEQGWQKLAALMDQALEASMEIQAEANERMATEGTEGFPCYATMMTFEAASPGH